MNDRKGALNPAQVEVLAWVGKGSPEGVYSDWSHRVTARALHNRGLVIVKGHGQDWSAKLTDQGNYYLDHGTFPSPIAVAADMPVTADSQRSNLTRAARTVAAPRKRSEPKPKKPGPLDQMMAALREADGHRIVVARSEERRYRQLAGAAKRFGRIPDGMRIAISRTHDRQCSVTLEPRPAWQTAKLEPIAVSKRLRDPSDVVTALSESDTFPVTGDPRTRALRLTDALVRTARERGVVVTALLNQPVNRGNYRGTDTRLDQIELVVDSDRFRLWFTQATLRKPHEPTRREIARV